MAERDTKTDELLNQVLAELKAINERNRIADEKEARKVTLLEINKVDLLYLIVGIGLGFMAQIFYDYYGSFVPNAPFLKLTGGVIVFLFFLDYFSYMLYFMREM